MPVISGFEAGEPSTRGRELSSTEILVSPWQPDQAIAGPVLIQGFLQYLCQGVIITQFMKFHDRCKDDPMPLRFYVATLFLFSILQTMLESFKVWLVAIEGLPWWSTPIHPTEPLCNAVICTLCEAYLIKRCWKVTGKLWVLLALAAMSATTFVASIILTVRIAMVIGPGMDSGHADPLHASSFAYPLWVYGTLLTAISLTSILSYSLWQTKTGLSYLDRTLAHIIFLTWETAALPSACMLASAAIFSVRESQGFGESVLARSHLDVFFSVITGKVYTLGLLRTLNSRTQFRARLNSHSLGRQSLSDWHWANPPARGGDQAAEQTSCGGEVETRRGTQETVVSVTESRKEPSTAPQADDGEIDIGEPRRSLRLNADARL